MLCTMQYRCHCALTFSRPRRFSRVSRLLWRRLPLRLAAAALRSSKSALGAYFRRMSARMDKPKAVAAAAHTVARLIYTMLTKGEEYTDQGQDYFEERYRERVLRQLNQRANKMGMKLVAVEQHA